MFQEAANINHGISRPSIDINNILEPLIKLLYMRIPKPKETSNVTCSGRNPTEKKFNIIKQTQENRNVQRTHNKTVTKSKIVNPNTMSSTLCLGAITQKERDMNIMQSCIL